MQVRVGLVGCAQDPNGCDLSVFDDHLHGDGAAKSVGCPRVCAILIGSRFLKGVLLLGAGRLYLGRRLILDRFARDRILDRSKDTARAVGSTGYNVYFPGLLCFDHIQDRCRERIVRLRLAGCREDLDIDNLSLLHRDLHGDITAIPSR